MACSVWRFHEKSGQTLLFSQPLKFDRQDITATFFMSCSYHFLRKPGSAIFIGNFIGKLHFQAFVISSQNTTWYLQFFPVSWRDIPCSLKTANVWWCHPLYILTHRLWISHLFYHQQHLKRHFLILFLSYHVTSHYLHESCDQLIYCLTQIINRRIFFTHVTPKYEEKWQKFQVSKIFFSVFFFQ